MSLEEWEIPTTYGIMIHSKEYCDKHFNQDDIYYFRSTPMTANGRIEKKWCSKVVFLSHYGQQASLQIPDWAIDFKIYNDTHPEYFI